MMTEVIAWVTGSLFAVAPLAFLSAARTRLLISVLARDVVLFLSSVCVRERKREVRLKRASSRPEREEPPRV